MSVEETLDRIRDAPDYRRLVVWTGPPFERIEREIHQSASLGKRVESVYNYSEVLRDGQLVGYALQGTTDMEFDGVIG